MRLHQSRKIYLCLDRTTITNFGECDEGTPIDTSAYRHIDTSDKIWKENNKCIVWSGMYHPHFPRPPVPSCNNHGDSHGTTTHLRYSPQQHHRPVGVFDHHNHKNVDYQPQQFHSKWRIIVHPYHSNDDGSFGFRIHRMPWTLVRPGTTFHGETTQTTTTTTAKMVEKQTNHRW